MINLGDYLGQLLGELTMARLQADLEAVRIAELYASHELLKHFPIPRVRVKNVELDIPFVIVQAENPPHGGSPRGGLSSEEMRKRFLRILQEQSERHSIEFDEQEKAKLGKSLESLANFMKRPHIIQVDTNLVVDRFTSTVQKILEPRRLEIGSEKLNAFMKSVRLTARTDFIEARSDAPRIVIGATSAEIREASPESVVRITLNVLEEGMEWTHISSGNTDDTEINRLVPE